MTSLFIGISFVTYIISIKVRFLTFNLTRYVILKEMISLFIII